MTKPLSYSWLEIRERALISNIRAHRRLLDRGVKLLAVLKSNAYGHGLELTARVCERSHQVDMLGVAGLNEALTLKQEGINLPILVLSYFRPFISHDLITALSQKISFAIYEEEQLKALEQAAKKCGKVANVHLKLETGMARLGVSCEQAVIFLKRILSSPYLKLEGVATHFATAESQDHWFLNEQLNNFNNFLSKVKNLLPKDLYEHTACTAAITTSPKSQRNLVRLGIGLYGLWPSTNNKQMVQKNHPNFDLKPALTWKTQIIQIQNLPAKTPVGYDCSFVTKRPTVMATLPIGYWDGYDRKLSNRGSVIIHGTKCKIIGKICMNITMVDVTEIPNVKVGDEVVLLGKQKNEEITADEIATLTETINYEVVTRINPQLPRVLV
ncbi:MAG: alanine racemase [Patescibacteria group bacterium]